MSRPSTSKSSSGKSSSGGSSGDGRDFPAKYLVGELISEITGSKLPSKKQVLQYMLYVNATKRDNYQSAKETFLQMKSFWDKAGLPTVKFIMEAIK